PWRHPEIVAAGRRVEIFDTRVERAKTADKLLRDRVGSVVHHQEPPAAIGLNPHLLQETGEQRLTVVSWRDDQELNLRGFANHCSFALGSGSCGGRCHAWLIGCAGSESRCQS